MSRSILFRPLLLWSIKFVLYTLAREALTDSPNKFHDAIVSNINVVQAHSNPQAANVLSCCLIYDKTMNKNSLSVAATLHSLMLWSLCVHAVCLSYISNEKKNIVDVFILYNNLACFNVTCKNNSWREKKKLCEGKKPQRIYTGSVDWTI